MAKLASAAIVVVLAGAAPWAAAQLLPPRGLPNGSAPAVDPYQALSFFQGNWTIAGLPAGTRFDESCTWLGTMKRHLVCQSRTESANGVQEGLGVFSYRPADGAYVYRSFDPNGDVDVLEGRLIGDTWQFTGSSGSGTTARRTRMTITPGGERSFNLAEETAIGNGPWQAQSTVRYVPSVAPVTSQR